MNGGLHDTTTTDAIVLALGAAASTPLILTACYMLRICSVPKKIENKKTVENECCVIV